MRIFARSKIHHATVTEANIEYMGSIAIDAQLLEKADILPGEKVLVVSLDSGVRLETYVIEGERGSGKISMNGAAAHLIKAGEKVIIIAFEISETPINTSFILVDEKNQYLKNL